MAEKSPVVIDARVAAIYELEAQIAALQEQRAALAAELIEEGEGTYVENGEPDARKVLVVKPEKWSTKYDLYGKPLLDAFLAARGVKKATPELTAEFREAQETAARELLGDHFKTCFDRLVSFTPAKAYADMIPRLFPTAPATARKALLLCQIAIPPKDPYIRLPDKPKTLANEDGEG